MGVLATIQAASAPAGNFLKAAHTDGFEKTEAHHLKILPEVKRDGNLLLVRAGGRNEVFKNNDSNGEAFAKYTLIGFYVVAPTRSDYLINEQLYEGSRIILINGQTGVKLTLEAEPAMSPDKKNYLVASLDLDAGYLNNSISIYTVDDFRPAFAFSWPNLDPEKLMSGPENAAWISDARVSFTEVSRGSDLDEHTRGTPRSRHPMSVEKRDGKWIGPLSPDGKIEKPQDAADTRF